MDNHNERKEIIDSRKYKNGYSIRFSDTLKRNMIYYATAFNDGSIIRSSMPIEFINNIDKKYFYYYISIVFLIMIIAILFSIKFSNIIVLPIRTSGTYYG